MILTALLLIFCLFYTENILANIRRLQRIYKLCNFEGKVKGKSAQVIQVFSDKVKEPTHLSKRAGDVIHKLYLQILQVRDLTGLSDFLSLHISGRAILKIIPQSTNLKRPYTHFSCWHNSGSVRNTALRAHCHTEQEQCSHTAVCFQASFGWSLSCGRMKPLISVSMVLRHVFLGLLRLRLPSGVKWSAVLEAEALFLMMTWPIHKSSLHDDDTHAPLLALYKQLLVRKWSNAKQCEE